MRAGEKSIPLLLGASELPAGRGEMECLPPNGVPGALGGQPRGGDFVPVQLNVLPARVLVANVLLANVLLGNVLLANVLLASVRLAQLCS